MDKVRVKIEIPNGSNVKYEINKDTGVIEVDRIMKMPLPYNYGFVPDTLWDDGDPLDVILIGNFSLHPGVELEATPIAVVLMHDNGESDYKLVCAVGDEDFNDYREVICSFLETYKQGVEIKGTTQLKREIKKVVERSFLMFEISKEMEAASK